MVLGIYGAGGLGREVLELARIINERNHRWDDFAFVDDGASDDIVNGAAVYAYEEALEKFSGNLEMAMGVGEPSTRERLFAKLERDGIVTPALIHPDVHIPETTAVGKGAIIQGGCFISCNVKIEDYVLIQPLAGVGHDDKLCVGAVISSMSALAGNVSVGRYTYIGLSVAIKEGVSIGDHSIVGMHSAVHRDVESDVVAIGNPARPMKRNEERRVFK